MHRNETSILSRAQPGGTRLRHCVLWPFESVKHWPKLPFSLRFQAGVILHPDSTVKTWHSCRFANCMLSAIRLKAGSPVSYSEDKCMHATLCALWSVMSVRPLSVKRPYLKKIMRPLSVKALTRKHNFGPYLQEALICKNDWDGVKFKKFSYPKPIRSALSIYARGRNTPCTVCVLWHCQSTPV